MAESSEPNRRTISRRHLLWGAGGAAVGAVVGASVDQKLRSNPSSEIQPVTEEERRRALGKLAAFMKESSSSGIVEDFMKRASPEEIKKSFTREKNPFYIDDLGSGYLKDSWSLRLPPTEPTVPDTYWDSNYFYPTIAYFEAPDGLEDPNTIDVGGSATNYAETERIQLYLKKNGQIEQGLLRGFDVRDTHFKPTEIDTAFRGFASADFFDENNYLQPGESFTTEDSPPGYNVFREHQNGLPAIVWKLSRGFSLKANENVFLRGDVDYNGRTFFGKIVVVSASNKEKKTPIIPQEKPITPPPAAEPNNPTPESTPDSPKPTKTPQIF